MKKMYAGMIAAILLIVACSKEYNPVIPNLGQTYNVRFNVNSFDITYTTMATNNGNKTINLMGKTVSVDTAANPGDLGGYIQTIAMAVYDAQGTLVTNDVQEYGETDFGSFSAQLASGDYTICVVATNKAINTDTSVVGNGNGFIGFDYSFPSSFNDLFIYSSNASNDIFYAKRAIQVGNADTTFSNINPSRLTGALQINLLDSATVGNNLLVTIKNAPYRYFVLSDSLQCNPQYSFSYNILDNPSFILGSFNPLTIELKTPAVTKTVSDVYVYPNKKTILTGSVNSSDSSNASFPIRIDTAYSETLQQNF
jgi:hypothetical protein